MYAYTLYYDNNKICTALMEGLGIDYRRQAGNAECISIKESEKGGTIYAKGLLWVV